MENFLDEDIDLFEQRYKIHDFSFDIKLIKSVKGCIT